MTPQFYYDPHMGNKQHTRDDFIVIRHRFDELIEELGDTDSKSLFRWDVLQILKTLIVPYLRVVKYSCHEYTISYRVYYIVNVILYCALVLKWL